jgi:hypothetical protein
MHLSKSKASDKADALEAAYKQVEAMKKKKDEARGEEASQRSQQQECILSGGVYLRHRLEKQALKKSACFAFPT